MKEESLVEQDDHAMAAARLPVYPDFPLSEYESRYARARAIMASEGLDALLITAETNYIYFTGHHSQQNPIDKIRPYVLLLPRDGDPICIVMPFEEGHVRLTTFIKSVHTYNLLKHNEAIVDAIRECGLASSAIGCELGREQYLELSLNDFVDLKSRLPQVDFRDGSSVLLQLRVVKSDAEVERCRASAQIAASALERALGEVRPGNTNIEVAQLVRRYIVEGGGERATFMAVSSGYDFTQGKITVPTPRRLEVGDTLTVDTGAQLRGYASDVCRTVVIGKASQKQKDMYRFVIDLNHVCYEAIRPGNTCADVVRKCMAEVERVGRKTQAVGRIGHGVGCETTEYPSLSLLDEVEIVPNMVFACNPNFVTDHGFFNSEENLVVTKSAPQFLSEPIAPSQLRVVG
jgi:Xaa-Pro aminopeptidase